MVRWRAAQAGVWSKAALVFLAAAVAGLALWAGPARAQAQDFLPFDRAFQFEARFVDAQHIEVRWTIAPDYYLYHDRIAFETEGGGALGPAQLPQGIIKFDENFGKDMHMHRGELVARIPVLALDAQGAVQLVATSQGCADAGLCYPPTQQRARLKPGGQDALTLALDAAAPQELWSALPGQGFDATARALPEPSTRSIDQDPGRIEAALRDGASWRVVLLFVLLGLLLSFTPCVLPMVPILSSIIAGQQKIGHPPMAHAKGFTLALAYTLGMALVYTALGVAAGLAGEGLAARLQTPLVLGTFAVLMGVLALSMFGLYELQLPVALQSRLARLAGRQQAGVYVGAFIMGAISALIVGPCVAAPLAAALIYISQTGDVVLGGMALFAMALGMSVPLLLVGASAGFLLPRAGAWMESVRKFFGALLLAVALWMVAPIVPAWALMLAWAGLFIVGAAYLSVFDPLPAHASGWRRLWKGVGVLLAVAGTILILGVATGGRDVLQPLAHLARGPWAGGVAQAAAQSPRSGAWVLVRSEAELEAALAGARGRPVMLDFYADWCVSCKEMERLTFSDARVAQRMNEMLLLKADVTQNTAQDRALLKRFGLFGPPGIIFFDAQGREVKQARVIGFQAADAFLASMAPALAQR